MNNLKIKDTLKESYLLIFYNYKKLIAPIFFLSSIMFVSFIFVEWFYASDFLKIIKNQFFLIDFSVTVIFYTSILYLIILPIINLNIILGHHQKEKISHFIINPWQTMNYYQFHWISPLLLGLLIMLFFKIIPFSNIYTDISKYISLIIIAYFSVRISFTPIITLNLLCKSNDIKLFFFSKINNFLHSWKITKGNTFKIFLIMFLGNLPITSFLICRYFYLIGLNTKIVFPLLPSSIITGGDNFITYMVIGISNVSYTLNFITFVFLVFSIVISLSIRTTILENLEK